MAKRKRKPINNLVIVSDMHCGCQLGLCPPTGLTLDGGGAYVPSKLQEVVWQWWMEFWNEWVPRATHGEPYDVVVNGDAMDGRHHGATTQLSQNIADQLNLATKILAPIRDSCERLYMVRGTEVHAGPAGENEETLAINLKAVPDEAGKFSRFELWKRVGGKDGPLCHLAHHIGTTGRAAYESSAPQAELIAMFAEAGRSREEPPDYVIRSHRHRSIKVLSDSVHGEAATIVTPGWQLKTPFAFRIAGGRIAPPQFGGWIVRQGDEEFHTRNFYRTLGRARVEE